MADEADGRTQLSIRDRISAFNNLSEGKNGDVGAAGSSKASGSGSSAADGAQSRASTMPRSPSLSNSLPARGSKQPPGCVGLHGLGFGGGSNGREVDEFGNMLPSSAFRQRAGSAGVVGGRQSVATEGRKGPPPVIPPKRVPAPSLPSRPSAASTASNFDMLSPAASPPPSGRSRGSSLVSTAGTSARSLSPLVSANASPGLKQHSASPRIPVASIISLYNNPPGSDVTVKAGSDGKLADKDSAMAPSPTDQSSLDLIPPMIPSPISRPSSPGKAMSPSLAPRTTAYPHDDLSSLFSGGSTSPRPPDTPPRSFTPNSRSGLSSPVHSPSPSRRGTQGSIAIPGVVPEELNGQNGTYSSPLSAKSRSNGEAAGWSGAFSLQPPTPYNHRDAVSPSSSPSRGATWPVDDSPNAAHAYRSRQKLPPSSLAASVSSTSSLSSAGGPPQLPPRRASSGSAASTPTQAGAPSLPPSLPPRRTPTLDVASSSSSLTTQTTAKHSRNLTNTSFHSISLSDTETDPLQSDLPPPPAHPSSPQPQSTSRPPSSQSTPTMGSGNLSSFTRAPLPPPRRTGTVSIESNFPRPPSLAKPAAPRQQQRQQQQEKARAVERYEVMWDAQCGVEEREGRGPRAGEERRLSAVVVGELWQRSRLPKGVLGQIWTQCDPYRRGSLDRDGFVKGMGLIDDELKRRHKRRLNGTRAT